MTLFEIKNSGWILAHRVFWWSEWQSNTLWSLFDYCHFSVYDQLRHFCDSPVSHAYSMFSCCNIFLAPNKPNNPAVRFALLYCRNIRSRMKSLLTSGQLQENKTGCQYQFLCYDLLWLIYSDRLYFIYCLTLMENIIQGV